MSELTGDSQAIHDWVGGNRSRAEAAVQRHHDKLREVPDPEWDRLKANLAFWEALLRGIRADEPESLSEARRLWELAGSLQVRRDADGWPARPALARLS